MIPKPPILEELPLGTQLVAGMGHSTVIADIDFETYSEAGFIWNEATQSYDGPPNANGKGLPVVGLAVYAEHPSTEVLCLAYDLKDGLGKRHWTPDKPLPMDLGMYAEWGGLIEAWNVSFERAIWQNVCVQKYGFPHVQPWQWRCAAAKARAHALPGSLDPAGKVLNISHKKLEDGKRLIRKFSMPRNPTKKDPRHRIPPSLSSELDDTIKLYDYNLQDIAAEAELSSLIPDLSYDELIYWQCEQAINIRGVAIDVSMVRSAIAIVEQAHQKYNRELRLLTGGRVQSASKVADLRAWLMQYGINAPTLDAEIVTDLLKIRGLPLEARRALEIRQMLAAASVKKLYAMINQVGSDGRLHDLFLYHAARTGREAGVGPQPQNLVNHGPNVAKCASCKKCYGIDALGNVCPWCGYVAAIPVEWNPQAVDDALETIATASLACVEYYWGNAIEIISSCMRGMFISAPGHDLICSDYSAIEAVVLAVLAGEDWRVEVFRTHGLIYETSASKITGVSLQEYIRVRKDSGKHHADRKLGKVAELASGYGGWIGAWKNFKADEFLTEDQIKQAILAWRNASPAIVEFWGGQQRDWYPCFYGIEGAAVQAVMDPGKPYDCRGIVYEMRGDALYCRLLSGRYITYHRPRLSPSTRRQDTVTLSFEGWNSNPKYGAPGWIRMETYGGKLTENVVQATARDLLTHAIVQLENAGYAVVLHVHDEIVVEVPEGTGSVEHVEQIMSTLPAWAAGWPVHSRGGWRAKRYAK